MTISRKALWALNGQLHIVETDCVSAAGNGAAGMALELLFTASCCRHGSMNRKRLLRAATTWCDLAAELMEEQTTSLTESANQWFDDQPIDWQDWKLQGIEIPQEINTCE